MKKISIIGANSYIARNVIKLLNLRSNEYLIELYDHTEFHIDGQKNYKKVDIFSKSSLSTIDLNSDVILIFTGKTGSINGFTEYDAFIDINEKTLLAILNEYVNQKSNAKIVFPSTRLVYKGKPGKLDEDAEKEFKTIYAINKYSCEQYLEMFHRVYDVQYCIFRICVPYGTLIPNASSYGTAEFMLGNAKSGRNITLYGDGSSRRTLTYMGDLCSTIIEGSFSNQCKNSIFNIGGEDYSLKEMAELISKKYNIGIDYVPWPSIAEKIESGDTVFDSKKLDLIFPEKYQSKFSEWINVSNI